MFSLVVVRGTVQKQDRVLMDGEQRLADDEWGLRLGCEFQISGFGCYTGSCGLANLGDEAAFSCSTLRESVVVLVFRLHTGVLGS